MELNDNSLIAAIKAGDEASFRLLYRRHTPRLLQLVLRFVGGTVDDAEDVLQETWIAAIAALDGFRHDATFRTWLTGIAINRCRALLRKRGRWTELGDDDAIATTRASLGAERIDLERAIALLPAGYRAVVILHDVDGYTHEEIAHLLGVATGTSKAQLFHARRALRALLEPKPKLESKHLPPIHDTASQRLAASSVHP
jgi:RNA polymerase sigma-70 factor (ECF subfamily)